MRTTFRPRAQPWDSSILATTVILKDGTLHMDLYTESMDTRHHLFLNNCHPKYCASTIPYSQGLRLRRICSRKEDFEKRARDHLFAFGREAPSVDYLIQRVAPNSPWKSPVATLTKTTTAPSVISNGIASCTRQPNKNRKKTPLLFPDNWPTIQHQTQHHMQNEKSGLLNTMQWTTVCWRNKECLAHQIEWTPLQNQDQEMTSQLRPTSDSQTILEKT